MGSFPYTWEKCLNTGLPAWSKRCRANRSGGPNSAAVGRFLALSPDIGGFCRDEIIFENVGNTTFRVKAI